MPRSTHSSTRWPRQLTLQGLIALRVWMVLVLAMLGLGTGSRPSPTPSIQVAEQGLRALPTGPDFPGELPEEELPLRGEGEGEGEGEDTSDAEDAKDAKDAEDAQRRRAPASALTLAPELDLRIAAAVARHHLGVAYSLQAGSAHRSQLHNRGPPVA